MSVSVKGRLHSNEELFAGALISLPKMQSHYLNKVKRCKIGDFISLFNNQNGEWIATIQSIGKNNVEAFLLNATRPPQAVSKLFLAYAPVKHYCTEIVMQATEMGVSDIIPVYTERSIVRSVNIEKLLLSSIEASEQSERMDVPIIHQSINLNELLRSKPFAGDLLFCKERASVNEPHLLNGDGHCILIGPEGGFSKAEMQLIESYQFTKAVNFGSRIMRAPTAIVAALSYYQTIHGHWE